MPAEHAQQIVGVAAVVHNDDGKVLLIKTAQAGWELPGGHVEQNEDLISALEREVAEETCCKVKVGRQLGVTSHLGTPSTVVLTFLCSFISGELQPADDSIESGWHAPETAAALVTHPIERLRLQDAIGNPRPATYRAYVRRNSNPAEYEMLREHLD